MGHAHPFYYKKLSHHASSIMTQMKMTIFYNDKSTVCMESAVTNINKPEMTTIATRQLLRRWKALQQCAKPSRRHWTTLQCFTLLWTTSAVCLTCKARPLKMLTTRQLLFIMTRSLIITHIPAVISHTPQEVTMTIKLPILRWIKITTKTRIRLWILTN